MTRVILLFKLLFLLEVFSDGGSRGNPGPAGAGWVLKLDGKRVVAGRKFLGIQTNNYAEYAAFLYAIADVIKLAKPELPVTFYLDSNLIVNQINGKFKVKHPGLKPLHQKALRGLEGLKWKAVHVRRELNAEADSLANEAMNKG